MVRALITGGAGFIGSHLAEELINKGYDVMIVDDLSTGTMDNISHLIGNEHFSYAIENIINETVMDRLISECDVIFHLAASVGVNLIIQRPVEVIQNNIIGTEHVLRIANRYRKKVLLASTSEIYGKSTKVPFSEDDDRLLGATTKNRWSYSCSKAIDEFLALAYWHENKLPVINFRLFNTIGPRQTGRYGMVAPRFVQQALAGETITVYGDGTQSRCFTFVMDVVTAIIALSENEDAIGEVFNIGSVEEISIMDLAKRVIELTGSNSDIKLIPYSEAYEAGFEDMQRRVPDISKIRNALGWSPTTQLDEILFKIIEYYKGNLELLPQ